jgi:hypothetical protein
LRLRLRLTHRGRRRMRTGLLVRLNDDVKGIWKRTGCGSWLEES